MLVLREAVLRGGYTTDHNRIRLGEGEEVFARAVKAIRQWKMFDMPWIQLCWPDAPIEEGATVAVLVSHLGFWSLNASRIVYVIEQDGSDKKFGFAYGTLVQACGTRRGAIQRGVSFPRPIRLVRRLRILSAEFPGAVGLSFYQGTAEAVCKGLDEWHAKSREQFLS